MTSLDEQPVNPVEREGAEIKVFIVEDHPNLRRLLKIVLDGEEGFRTCGCVGSAEEALEQYRESNPDLILVDLSLPQMHGLDLIRHLKENDPDVRCLVLSGHGDQVLARKVMEAGAVGYIIKDSPGEVLCGIHAVVNGETYMSPQLAES